MATIDREVSYEDKKEAVEHVETTNPAEANYVRNAALAEALGESEIQRWSRTSVQLYLAVFVAFLCSCANGYDGSLLSGILSMPYFEDTFGLSKTGEDQWKISVMASLYTVGQMVGALPAAVISDRYGRRTAMFTGAWCIITGTIVCATAHAMAQFVVGRFILGLGITVMFVAAPAYSMEIAPPQWRGRCTGLLNCGWFAGSIPAAAVTYATNYIKSDMSWRIPVILQAFTCVIVIGTVYLIPESPRWQMANGKEEEAFAFLVKYHGGGNPNSKLVVLQMEEFKDQITTSGSDKTWWDYRPLFATRNARWRTLQVALMSVSGQFSGNGLGYFNTIIYRKIGVTSVVMQLAFNLVYAVVSAIGALIGACLSDRMPRRIPLVFGTLVCAGWLAINAGLQTKIAMQGENINAAVGRGALASYFMFTFTFMFCYTPLQAVVPVEALENMMRAKGLGFGSVISGSMGFLNQFAGPIALEKINYGYIWFFAGWDVVEAGLWWLFCVEGQGRTLEELAWVYDQPNPVKASIGLTKNHHVEAHRDVNEL